MRGWFLVVSCVLSFFLSACDQAQPPARRNVATHQPAESGLQTSFIQTIPADMVDVGALSQHRCKRPIQIDLKYATNDNIIGRVVLGYDPAARHVGLLSRATAEALIQVQCALNQRGYGVVIFDAYRPYRSVRDFFTWVGEPEDEQDATTLARKKHFYPNLSKEELFEQGYFSLDSDHTYGNAVDVMLVDLRTNKLVDMGTSFDVMDERSHSDMTADKIGMRPYRFRQLLLEHMLAAGFEAIVQEWWHFRYLGMKGRLTSIPMDFPITLDLKGRK